MCTNNPWSNSICRAGDLAILKTLLNAPSVDLEIADRWNRTPLLNSIYCRCQEIVELLIMNGAILNMGDCETADHHRDDSVDWVISVLNEMKCEYYRVLHPQLTSIMVESSLIAAIILDYTIYPQSKMKITKRNDQVGPPPAKKQKN